MTHPVLQALLARQEADLPTHGGRTLAYVYDSGLAEADEVGRAAVAAYAASNGLDPTAFPSLLAMENEVVGLTADLLDAPADAVGTVTSGGTESVLLAVQSARDARPEVERPRMVVPSTIHAAFPKAAHYFGVEAVVVPVGPDFRVDPAAVAAAVAEAPERTVLVAVSAPSYAHGVVDRVPEVAAVAAAHGTRCHVDACIGGWVLGWARGPRAGARPAGARAGIDVPDWTFAVPGVTSISVDLHKYAYTPKGASVLLHRTPDLRRPQLFAWAGWPGYTMLNSTLQSTKSGGPLAGAWAVLRTIGAEGYAALVAQVLDAVDAVVAGVADIDGLRVVATPDSSLVALATDERCDVFSVADLMADAGWLVQPQLSFTDVDGTTHPPTLHLSLSAATAPHVEEMLAALADAVRRAQASGPVPVDPGVAAFVAALDPATLSADDFAGLLAAAGIGTGGTDGEAGGTIGMPERMAPVNALLDVAAPRLREALLTTFLDRLSRPARGGWERPPAG